MTFSVISSIIRIIKKSRFVKTFSDFERNNDKRAVFRKIWIRSFYTFQKRAVLLCDPTKLRDISPFCLCSLRDVDTVVATEDIHNYFSLNELPEILW